MSDLQQLWRLTWMGELGRHLATELTPLLPDDRELVATGADLSIVIRKDGAPLRVAASYELPTPGEQSVLDAEVVDMAFREVQDEIALHLGRAWPVSANQVALRAIARESYTGVTLSFEPASGDLAEAVVLGPFVPPPPLRRGARGGLISPAWRSGPLG